VLYASPHKVMTDLHWAPRFTDIDAIVATAWQWHQSHQPRRGPG
jgi:UDP-glucose 4-epimerase